MKISAIKNHKDFKFITNSGIRFKAGSFIAYAVTNSCCEFNGEYGILISKKFGKAVTRNKAKRRVRPILRELAKQTSFFDKFKIIVIPHKNIIEEKFTNLTLDFFRAIEFFQGNTC